MGKIWAKNRWVLPAWKRSLADRCFACVWCSLTVWLNGKRRGVMVKRGLKGPLRWAVDLNSASVRIDGPKPPPG